MPKLKVKRVTGQISQYLDDLHSKLYFMVFVPEINKKSECYFSLADLVYKPREDYVSQVVYDIVFADAQMQTYSSYAYDIYKQDIVAALKIQLAQILKGLEIADLAHKELGEQVYYDFLYARVFRTVDTALKQLCDLLMNTVLIKSLPAGDEWIDIAGHCAAHGVAVCNKVLASYGKDTQKICNMYEVWQKNLSKIISHKRYIDRKVLELRYPEIAEERKVLEANAAAIAARQASMLYMLEETASYMRSSITSLCGSASSAYAQIPTRSPGGNDPEFSEDLGMSRENDGYHDQLRKRVAKLHDGP